MLILLLFRRFPRESTKRIIGCYVLSGPPIFNTPSLCIIQQQRTYSYQPKKKCPHYQCLFPTYINIEQIQVMKRLQGNNLYLSIISKLEYLEEENKKLLSIAEQAERSSFVRQQNNKVPPMIARFEQDMRASFNALIEGVREYFVSIDEKMKEIARMLEQQLCSSEAEKTQQHSPSMQWLIGKIQILQANMKKTQQNQSKLIQIIEQLAGKTRNQQQKTILKQNSTYLGLNSPEKHESSFRLFSVQDESGFYQPRSRNISINQPQQPNNYKKPELFTCMPSFNHSVRSIPMPKRSLRGQRQAESQAPDKTHRMNFMMKLLQK